MFTLRLKNYRGFLNAEFAFSRVNILIGENSAGKSSILKFLLMLRRSLGAIAGETSNLTFAGDEADLGDYRETIYCHETKRNLFFEFEFSAEYLGFATTFFDDNSRKRSDIQDQVFSSAAHFPTVLGFEVSSELDDPGECQAHIANKRIGKLEILNRNRPLENSTDAFSRLCDVHFSPAKSKKLLILDGIEYARMGFLSLIDAASLRRAIDEQVQDKKAALRTFNQIAFLLLTQNYLQVQLAQLEYLNPLSSDPAARLYLKGDRKSIRRIRSIKDLLDFLANSHSNSAFLKELNRVLKSYGIADGVRIENTGKTQELRVKIKGVESNVKDVGYGVALQIPIFAQAILSERDRGKGRFSILGGPSVLIEQPEVHLYPRLQARFIEALLKVKGDNVYFIETHSEHIVRKLQILASQNSKLISPEEISIYYFHKSGKRMIANRHNINPSSGNLEPKLPSGFFDVSYQLAFQLLK